MKAGPGEAHCLEATFAREFIDHLDPTTLEFLTSEAQLKIVTLKQFAVPEVVVLVWDTELHMQGSMSALDVYNGQSWGTSFMSYNDSVIYACKRPFYAGAKSAMQSSLL
jgi:hypothetical protein